MLVNHSNDTVSSSHERITGGSRISHHGGDQISAFATTLATRPTTACKRQYSERVHRESRVLPRRSRHPTFHGDPTGGGWISLSLLARFSRLHDRRVTPVLFCFRFRFIFRYPTTRTRSLSRLSQWRIISLS